MHKQNPLGIYVYPHDIYMINDINFKVNSISYDMSYNIIKFRVIDHKHYGIHLSKSK